MYYNITPIESALFLSLHFQCHNGEMSSSIKVAIPFPINQYHKKIV